MEALEYRSNPIQYTYGDSCDFVSTVTFAPTAGAGANGTEVDLVKLEAGTQIIGVTVINNALGASTNIQVGYKYINPADGAGNDAAFFPASSTAAGNRRDGVFHPALFKSRFKLVAKITGADATGKVSIITRYKHVGI